MEKGFYITPLGERLEVLDFDPINKMVYVPLVNGNFMWVHDTAYLAWQKEGAETAVPVVEEVAETVLPEEVAIEVVVEEVKKKRTTKKKEA
tara:strand:- start:1724 stop:1996 length:273 start_codon:yes stop_codon:yes gene_type:complete